MVDLAPAAFFSRSISKSSNLVSVQQKRDNSAFACFAAVGDR